jgi:flagellar biosynthesis anti-sigma factor FlgM
LNVNPSGPQNIRPDGVPTGPARTRPDVSAARDPYRAAAGGDVPARSELSSQAQEFVKMRRDLDALPAPGRAERIAALRELIARGAYSVDGERIAGAMLRDRATARALGLSPTP